MPLVTAQGYSMEFQFIYTKSLHLAQNLCCFPHITPHCWYVLLCLVHDTESHPQVLQVHNMRTRSTSRTNRLVTWRNRSPHCDTATTCDSINNLNTPRQGQLKLLNHIKRKLNTECTHGFQINSNDCVNTKRLTEFQLWHYETPKPSQFSLDSTSLFPMVMKYTWDDKIRPTLYTTGKKRGTNSADRRKDRQNHVHVCLLSKSDATSRIILGSKDSYPETPMSFLFVFSKRWGV